MNRSDGIVRKTNQFATPTDAAGARTSEQSQVCGAAAPPPLPSTLHKTIHSGGASQKLFRSMSDLLEPGVLTELPDRNVCSGGEILLSKNRPTTLESPHASRRTAEADYRNKYKSPKHMCLPLVTNAHQETISNIEAHSLVSSYYENWRNFLGAKAETKTFRDAALRGKLTRYRGFRSLFWRVFLDLSPNESNDVDYPSCWLKVFAEQRQRYDAIKSSLLIEESDLQPETNESKRDKKTTGLIDDPLNQNHSSRWRRFFADQELRVQIAQDVRRCMPEVPFFQEEATKTRLINVLFLFCRNFNVPYRQGMHELLAPVVFVVHQDVETFANVRAAAESMVDPVATEPEAPNDDFLASVFNDRYEEHDSYTLYAALFARVASMYGLQQPEASPVACNTQTRKVNTDALTARLDLIHDQLLRRCDFELHSHLTESGVAVQLYGIRWLRLLFGREFSLSDLLVVWDALLGDSLALTDWIFCALLVYVRASLLATDASGCLNILMRYPRVSDSRRIVSLARYLREPHRLRRPLLRHESFMQAAALPSRFHPPAEAESRDSEVSVRSSKSILPDWKTNWKLSFSLGKLLFAKKTPTNASASAASDLIVGSESTSADDSSSSNRQAGSNMMLAAKPGLIESLLRRDTIDTIFLVIETYADQAAAAVRALQTAIGAPNNRVENPDQLNNAIEDLQHIQEVLKATVSECRADLKTALHND